MWHLNSGDKNITLESLGTKGELEAKFRDRNINFP